MYKSSPGKDVHATGEGMKNFPTGEWSSYPCASCSTRNHDAEKCRRRQFVQLNPSKKKAYHFSSHRKRRNDKKGLWNKQSSLIVVRVDTILRSVGPFT
jgi:hypothetical protein